MKIFLEIPSVALKIFPLLGILLIALPPKQGDRGVFSLLIAHGSSLFPLRQIFSSDFEERSDDHYYIIHRQSIFSQIFGRDFSKDSDKPHVR